MDILLASQMCSMTKEQPSYKYASQLRPLAPEARIPDRDK